MRPVAFPAMLAALMLALPAATPPARAELVYVEDFEVDGEPGFDPMFQHEFVVNSYSPRPNEEPDWELREDSNYPEQGILLGLYGTQDTLTFALPIGKEITFASLEVRERENPSMDDYTSVDFVGKCETRRVYIENYEGYQSLQMSSDEIGPIGEIQIRGLEIWVDNIVIHATPEPGVVALGLSAFAVLTLKWLRGHRPK